MVTAMMTLLSGARFAGNSGSQSGSSYVVFGKATSGFAATMDLSALDGSDGFRIDGINEGDNSGISVILGRRC